MRTGGTGFGGGDGGVGTFVMEMGDSGPHKITVEIPDLTGVASYCHVQPAHSVFTLLQVRHPALLVEGVRIIGYKPEAGRIIFRAFLDIGTGVATLRNRGTLKRVKELLDRVKQAAGSWLDQGRLEIAPSGSGTWVINLFDEPGDEAVPYSIVVQIGTGDLLHATVEPNELVGLRGFSSKPDDVRHALPRFATLVGCLLEALFQESKAAAWPPAYAYRITKPHE